MGYSQIIPTNISKMQNRVFGPLTFRDLGFLLGSLAVGAAIFGIIPEEFGMFLRGFFAVVFGSFGLILGFLHLVIDIEPIEKSMFTLLEYKNSAKVMLWKKELISESGHYATDSTQSFFPFYITEDGILIYHDNGGGAALIKVDGVDYQLLSSYERDGIIGNFGSFLDSTNFPLQILIKTTPLDLRAFMENSNENIKNNKNHEGLLDASYDYLGLLEAYESADHIFNKTMYIVLPYTHEGEIAGNKSLGIASATNMEKVKKQNPINSFFNKKRNNDLDLSALQTQEFSEEFTIKILEDRMQNVLQFISSIQGVSAKKATLPEYVELFYYFFNINESNITSILKNSPNNNFASYSPDYSRIKEERKMQTRDNTKVEDRKKYVLDDLL